MATTAFDDYGNNVQWLDVPAGHAFTSSGDDTNELAHVRRAVYCGGAGDIPVVMKDGTAVTLKAVPVGTILPICVRQIKATGLTATNLVVFW